MFFRQVLHEDLGCASYVAIGRERRENPFCRIEDEDEFVRLLCSELAPQPPNFERIVELNRDGPPADAAPLEPLPPQRIHAFLDDGPLLLDGREPMPALDPAGLAERLRRGEVTLLDVREDDEWEEGHVEGSLHVPYHELRDGAPGELDGKPLAVACSAGNRSALAASLLRRHGVDHVLHVVDGGVEDLAGDGIELVG